MSDTNNIEKPVSNATAVEKPVSDKNSIEKPVVKETAKKIAKPRRLTPAEALLASMTARKAAQQLKGKSKHVMFDDQGNESVVAAEKKKVKGKAKNTENKKRASDAADSSSDAKKAKTEKTEDSTETKKKKAAKKPKAKKDKPAESISTTDGKDKQIEALDYLRLFLSNRAEWKFRKMQQIWLLQHIYDEDLVNESDFKILLEYLKDMQGSAREKTLKEAQAICEKSAKHLTSYGGTNDNEDDFDAEKMLAQASTTVSVEEDPKTQRAKSIVSVFSLRD
ncbi:hypothetical protein DFQ30_010139 [Apophysomyces sp. BC1015]|nr:hypothetical protein DFQ30_010139 [Apophysomyces sp. BC1015]